MLRMATKNVQLSFNDLIFRQTNGVAIDNPLGRILANIFVGCENNLLLKANKAICILLVR